MKSILTAALLAVLLAAPVSSAAAQQMSPEEAQQLMNAINEKMRQLEQMLAKASLPPEALDTIIQQLKEAAQSGDTARLPRSLREFLLNNPDLLAKLKNPGAEGDELLRTEDDIRRLLATQDDGLEQLLQQNPDMLRRLLEKQDTIEEALRNHAKAENDLQRLFSQAKDRMSTTEDDIKKLIEAAQQMQQQMNQQGQPKPDQLQQPQQGQDQQQRPENQNQQQQDGSQPQGAQNNYDAQRSQDGQAGSPRAVDPNAWEAILPQTETPPAGGAHMREKPQGWSAEHEEYFRQLAAQAVRERQLRARQQQPEGGNTPEGGNGGR